MFSVLAPATVWPDGARLTPVQTKSSCREPWPWASLAVLGQQISLNQVMQCLHPVRGAGLKLGLHLAE